MTDLKKIVHQNKRVVFSFIKPVCTLLRHLYSTSHGAHFETWEGPNSPPMFLMLFKKSFGSGGWNDTFKLDIKDVPVIALKHIIVK